MTKSCNIGGLRFSNYCKKHIRQRDLMLLLEQLVTLIDEGYTSGSQLVAMQNYMLQRGHTEQADLFYGVLRDRETGGGVYDDAGAVV